MEIFEVKDLQTGDKGYNGDADGYWAVVAQTSNWVHLESPDGMDTLTIPFAEAAEQDWRWFRDDA